MPSTSVISSNLNVEAKEFIPRSTPIIDSSRSNLIESVRRQLEFYFSDENLPFDNFMLEHIYNDPSGQGYFPFNLLCSFPKISKLTQDSFVVRDSVHSSSLLEMNSNGTGARRKDWGIYWNSTYNSQNYQFSKPRKNSKSKFLSPNLEGVKKDKKDKLKTKSIFPKEPLQFSGTAPKIIQIVKEKESFVLSRQPKGPETNSKGFSLEYRNARIKKLEAISS